MPRAVFEPATPATERPQTYALDRAATGIGEFYLLLMQIILIQISNLLKTFK
jgi:hypothetical protein